MSEKYSAKHEQSQSPENNSELDGRLHEISKEQQEKAKEALENDSAEVLENARQEAEKHAQESKPVEAESTTSELNTFAGHQLLKKDAYAQILKQTQAKLSAPSRAFSKFIHGKRVEAVSEISAKTVARPSGMLGGGIGAFLGSSVLLFTSKHYGFKYNYALFLIMFVGGFFAGLAVEALVKAVSKKKN